MKRGRLQAKDITDQAMLRAILEDSTINDLPGAWYRVAQDHPEWPAKVVLAKCRQLLRRELIDGCVCGCRGDFYLTEKGGELIGEEPWHRESGRRPIKEEMVLLDGVEWTMTTFRAITGA